MQKCKGLTFLTVVYPKEHQVRSQQGRDHTWSHEYWCIIHILRHNYPSHSSSVGPTPTPSRKKSQRITAVRIEPFFHLSQWCLFLCICVDVPENRTCRHWSAEHQCVSLCCVFYVSAELHIANIKAWDVPFSVWRHIKVWKFLLLHVLQWSMDIFTDPEGSSTAWAVLRHSD